MIQALALETGECSASVDALLDGRKGGSPGLVIVVEFDAAAAVRGLRALKRRWPAAKVLLVGLSNEEDTILRAFAAGAEGIVLAVEPLAPLVEAVDDVLAGLLRPPPSVCAHSSSV